MMPALNRTSHDNPISSSGYWKRGLSQKWDMSNPGCRATITHFGRLVREDVVNIGLESGDGRCRAHATLLGMVDGWGEDVRFWYGRKDVRCDGSQGTADQVKVMVLKDTVWVLEVAARPEFVVGMPAR